MSVAVEGVAYQAAARLSTGADGDRRAQWGCQSKRHDGEWRAEPQSSGAPARCASSAWAAEGLVAVWPSESLCMYLYRGRPLQLLGGVVRTAGILDVCLLARPAASEHQWGALLLREIAGCPRARRGLCMIKGSIVRLHMHTCPRLSSSSTPRPRTASPASSLITTPTTLTTKARRRPCNPSAAHQHSTSTHSAAVPSSPNASPNASPTCQRHRCAAWLALPCHWTVAGRAYHLTQHPWF